MLLVTVLSDADHTWAVGKIVEERQGALSHPEGYSFREGWMAAGKDFYPNRSEHKQLYCTRTTANVASSVWCPWEKRSTVLKITSTRSPAS